MRGDQRLGDPELVALARLGGDAGAFSELVHRHQAALRAFLTRYAGDASLAEDLAQEAFLKAFRALDQFKGGGSFRSWLFSIGLREFLQQRRRSQPPEQALQTDDAAEEALPEDATIDLGVALSRLPNEERAVILMCDAAGFTHAEAAAALGRPLGTVKTVLLRARSNMRDLLNPTAFGESDG